MKKNMDMEKTLYERFILMAEATGWSYGKSAHIKGIEIWKDGNVISIDEYDTYFVYYDSSYKHTGKRLSHIEVCRLLQLNPYPTRNADPKMLSDIIEYYTNPERKKMIDELSASNLENLLRICKKRFDYADVITYNPKNKNEVYLLKDKARFETLVISKYTLEFMYSTSTGRSGNAYIDDELMKKAYKKAEELCTEITKSIFLESLEFVQKKIDAIDEDAYVFFAVPGSLLTYPRAWDINQ